MPPDNQGPSLDRLIKNLNELLRQQAKQRDIPPRCDFCADKITAGDRVAIYLSNAELSRYIRPIPNTPLYWHRMYCEECDRQQIVYPHQSAIEILFACTRRKNGTHNAWKMRDTAAADVGESWDAHAAFQLIYGVPLDVYAPIAAQDNHTISHEDIVDILRLHRIGIRDVFDEGGNINVSPTTKEILRERIHKGPFPSAESVDDHEQFHTASHEQIVKHGRERPHAFTCPECEASAPTWAQLDHASTCSSRY